MINQNEKEVSDFFDECAQKGFMETFDKAEIRKLEKCLKHWNIKPGQRILEPGCGSGRLTEYLGKATGSEGVVYACDLSTEMVNKIRKRNLPEYVKVYRGSINNTPVNDGFFDKVICFQVFPHFSDMNVSLTEIARVLKTGGDLWINHLPSRDEINNLHRNASRVVVSHFIPSSDEMHSLLTQNGFKVIEISDTSEGYQAHAVKI